MEGNSAVGNQVGVCLGSEGSRVEWEGSDQVGLWAV